MKEYPKILKTFASLTWNLPFVLQPIHTLKHHLWMKPDLQLLSNLFFSSLKILKAQKWNDKVSWTKITTIVDGFKIPRPIVKEQNSLPYHVGNNFANFIKYKTPPRSLRCSCSFLSFKWMSLNEGNFDVFLARTFSNRNWLLSFVKRRHKRNVGFFKWELFIRLIWGRLLNKIFGRYFWIYCRCMVWYRALQTNKIYFPCTVFALKICVPKEAFFGYVPSQSGWKRSGVM